MTVSQYQCDILIPQSPLSHEVKVGYMKIKVKTYIPNPLRCFNCQRFRHHRDRCTRPPVCGRCGKNNIKHTDCQKETFCSNCKKKSPRKFQRLWSLERGKIYIQNEMHQKHYFPRSKENNSSKILWNIKKIHRKHKPTRTPNIRKQPNWNKTRSNYPTYKWDENTNPRNENYNNYWKQTTLQRKLKQQRFTKPRDTNKINREPKCPPPLKWSLLLGHHRPPPMRKL